MRSGQSVQLLHHKMQCCLLLPFFCFLCSRFHFAARSWGRAVRRSVRACSTHLLTPRVRQPVGSSRSVHSLRMRYYRLKDPLHLPYSVAPRYQRAGSARGNSPFPLAYRKRHLAGRGTAASTNSIMERKTGTPVFQKLKL